MLIREILQRLERREISLSKAEELIKINGFKEVGSIAKLDIGREVRKGVPEVVLAEGKSVDQILKISRAMLKMTGLVIISRLIPRQHLQLKKYLSRNFKVFSRPDSGIIVAYTEHHERRNTGGRVGVMTAGTADIPVAGEVVAVCQEMGCKVLTSYDIGVAGMHRLIPSLSKMISEDVDALVVCAGREGALPSVVASLVDVPVIAVPTSIGYGAGGGGEAALLSMLQACSLGIGVVNIDGGVAGGVVAALVANRVAKFRGMEKRVGVRRQRSASV